MAPEIEFSAFSQAQAQSPHDYFVFKFMFLDRLSEALAQLFFVH